jgi:hypothetical protein
MSDARPTVSSGIPVPPPEELTTITYNPTAHLTDEQKKWRVAKVVQREHFTMLEPMEPTNLTAEQKAYPVAEGRDTAPEVEASDLTALRGLIGRYGVNRLHDLIRTLAAAEGKAECR